MSDETTVIIDVRDKAVVAQVQCESLEEDRTQAMQSSVSAAGAEHRSLPVILDLSKVSFMPSLSLGALVTLLQGFRKEKQRFVLAGLQPDLRSVLAITRIDKLFDIADNVDEAIALVEKRG
jgi:anti-sigma B factor antagonist